MMPVLGAWPSVTAGDAEVADLRLGRAVDLKGGPDSSGVRVRICDPHGRLVALANSDGIRMRPFCVF